MVIHEKEQWLWLEKNIDPETLKNNYAKISQCASQVFGSKPIFFQRYLTSQACFIFHFHAPWHKSHILKSILLYEWRKKFSSPEDKLEIFFHQVCDSLKSTLEIPNQPKLSESTENWILSLSLVDHYQHDLIANLEGLGLGQILCDYLIYNPTNSRSDLSSAKDLGSDTKKHLKKTFDKIDSATEVQPWYLESFWLFNKIIKQSPSLYPTLSSECMENIMCLLARIGISSSSGTPLKKLVEEGFCKSSNDTVLNILKQTSVAFENRGTFFLNEDGFRISSNYVAHKFRKELLNIEPKYMASEYQKVYIETCLCPEEIPNQWVHKDFFTPAAAKAFTRLLLTQHYHRPDTSLKLQAWLVSSKTPSLVRAAILDAIAENELYLDFAPAIESLKNQDVPQFLMRKIRTLDVAA